MGKIAVGTHNTLCEGDHGPALADAERTGQERSVDSGHKRDEQAEESGETGDSGAGESGAQEREREPWVPSAAYLRMVDQGPRRAA
jgi:hypothetical protein